MFNLEANHIKLNPVTQCAVLITIILIISITNAVGGRTITLGTVSNASLVHVSLAVICSCGFTPSRRSISRWLFSRRSLRRGALCRGLLRGGTSCWRGCCDGSYCQNRCLRAGLWTICRRDLDICAVYKGFLLLSQSNSAVVVIIAAPVVSHRPPPLQQAVITCQTFGEHEFDVVIAICGRVELDR